MKQIHVLILVFFVGWAIGPQPVSGVTHDDKESLIPEFYITYKSTSAAARLNVTFEAYDEWENGIKTTYSETVERTGANNNTTKFSLFINKGMPLDMAGKLIVSGENIEEYSIFINVPDAKFVPCAYVLAGRVAGEDRYIPAERHLIKVSVTSQLSLPHTHRVFFKHAKETGELPGKASSAMAGWQNFKVSLGYGKTGKSLG